MAIYVSSECFEPLVLTFPVIDADMKDTSRLAHLVCVQRGHHTVQGMD